MPTNFGGNNPQHYTVPRENPIYYANKGFPFNAPTEAGKLGLRKNAVVSFTPRVVQDMAGRDILDGVDFKLEAELYQTSMAYLKNFYLLSRVHHQLRFRLQNGMYVNVVDNTEASATFTTPTGSSLVGMEMVLSVDDKDRNLKATWEGLLSDTEYEWILTNSTAAHTGGASGTSLGLTAMTYDRTGYKRSGIHKITVGGTSYGIGIFKEPKMTLKFTSRDRDHQNRPLTCFMDVEIEVTALQTFATELQAALEASRQDKTIVITTRCDETFTFSTGALSLSATPTFGDDKTFQKLSLRGNIPYNIDDESPDSLTWAANALTAALIGYA